MPFLWAAPEVYMTYKLSLKHPCASGGALWVELAFGEKTGLMVGYLGEYEVISVIFWAVCINNYLTIG